MRKDKGAKLALTVILVGQLNKKSTTLYDWKMYLPKLRT